MAMMRQHLWLRVLSAICMRIDLRLCVSSPLDEIEADRAAIAPPVIHHADNKQRQPLQQNI